MPDDVGTTAALLLSRLRELEQRIERLEQRPPSLPAQEGPAASETAADDDCSVSDRVGSVSALLAENWTRLSVPLGALGHPVRLELLRQIVSGAGAVAELQENDTGTSGRLYHHLRQLVSAGWLRTTTRGRYAVPEKRVPCLLAILLAMRQGLDAADE